MAKIKDSVLIPANRIESYAQEAWERECGPDPRWCENRAFEDQEDSFVLTVEEWWLSEEEHLFEQSHRHLPHWSGYTHGDLIEWAKKVKHRDGYCCQECGQTFELHAHHIKRKSEYPSLATDVDNGITLCKTCHAEKHPDIGFLRS